MYNKRLQGGGEMKTAIALGTFDGVHIAHRFVLDLPKEYKKVIYVYRQSKNKY